MTADGRVTMAREFLAAARRHKATDLPPSVLVRELAEARRQVGQLLSLIADFGDEERLLARAYLTPSGGAHIVAADVLVLGQALADAVAYRAPDTCRDCASGLPCDDAAEDQQRRHGYQNLADALNLVVEP